MAIRVYYSGGLNKGAVAQVQSKLPGSVIGKSNRTSDILDLMDATSVIPYMMAAGSVVGRGTIGPGFDVVESSIGAGGRESDRERILRFFNYISPNQNNIKDVFGPSAKLYTTAFSFRLFGHSAWEIIYDSVSGDPVGFDYIPGVIRPNVDSEGRFKNPAYVQYLRANGVDAKSEFTNPDNIIFFGVPDFGGGLHMTELLALAEYTLPSEIYAAMSYRSLHENRDAPYSGFWYTPKDIDDETFRSFVGMVTERYQGARNYGRNPIVMKGEGGFKSISIPKDEAPYIEGRSVNRSEISAASGVPGAKYGVGIESVGANALRELRREFYESTLRPSMELLEETMYRHVCIRLFDAPEWRFKFHRPDFTTAVEDASIELRRIQWGQWSPNEARASRGEAPREEGDYYLIPSNMMVQGEDGRPDNEGVDDDAGDMEPSEEDTVPGTQPPEKPEQDDNAVVSELRKWRKFSLRVANGKRDGRDFVTTPTFPIDLAIYIDGSLAEFGDDADSISMFFNDIIDIIAAGDVRF